MTPSPSSDPDRDLTRQRDELAEQVYALRDEATGGEASDLENLLTPRDPRLAQTLASLFHRTSTGKKEALRMEVDVLRRLSRCGETERIFRPYGVLELATPIRIKGRTRFAVRSGPLNVSAWSAAERETLARLCGIRAADLPDTLTASPVYTPEQVESLVDLQEQLAAWVVRRMEAESAASTAPEPAPLPPSANLLHPGFADHLEMLFAKIQKHTTPPRALSEVETDLLYRISDRGRRLCDQWRRLRDTGTRDTGALSVHAILAAWCAELERRLPHLRIRSRLEADEDIVHANPQRLHHVLYTLLSGIADGLPDGRALLGVATRAVTRRGRPTLLVEVRDGGGLATFAGVGGELDRQLELEQNQTAEETAEWTDLASHLGAEIRILREADLVTRAELFLPLAAEDDGEVPARGTHQLWIVEDDDREYDHLLRMLHTEPVACTRFRTAEEVKSHFASASHPADLVILKYYLPDERGADVRQWLYEQDPDLPVILLSSLNATHPGIATVNRLPGTLYLQKPFDASSLLEMLRMNWNP